MVLIADRIKVQDTNAGEPEEGRAVIPRSRCTFPGCGRRLELAAVEGVASSVGLGSEMRRNVCPDHPPVGACSRCGMMAGPQYMVKVLVNGRCPDCVGKPVRAAVVIGRALADLSRGGPEVGQNPESPKGVTPRLTPPPPSLFERGQALPRSP